MVDDLHEHANISSKLYLCRNEHTLLLSMSCYMFLNSAFTVLNFHTNPKYSLTLDDGKKVSKYYLIMCVKVSLPYAHDYLRITSEFQKYDEKVH